MLPFDCAVPAPSRGRLATAALLAGPGLALLLSTATLASAQAPKEVVVVSQYRNDAEFNGIVTSSGNALAAQLTDMGQDVTVVKMGDGQEVPCLGDLEAHLQGRGLGSGLSSIHFLGHGFKGGMYFDCPEEQKTYVEEEAARAADDEGKVQFGKAKFAAMLDRLLQNDGKIYLEHCWTANTEGGKSMAQRLAEETGRQVSGHTDVVKFQEQTPPGSFAGDEVVVVPGSAPTLGYDGSSEKRGPPKGKGTEPGPVIGRTYCWDVALPLNADTCDLHIEVDPKLKTTNFKDFTAKVPPDTQKGWKGKVTTEGKGSEKKQYLTWYTDDCKKDALQGVRVVFCVDLIDKKAQDKIKMTGAWTLTGSGGSKLAGATVVKDGTTQVPVFVAYQGDLDGNGRVNRGDYNALLDEVPGACSPANTQCSTAFYAPNADLDCDGCVGACDRDLLLAALDAGRDPEPCRPDGTQLVLDDTALAATALASACSAHLALTLQQMQAFRSGDPLALQRAIATAAVGASIGRVVVTARNDRAAFIGEWYALDGSQVDAAGQALALQLAACEQQLQAALVP